MDADYSKQNEQRPDVNFTSNLAKPAVNQNYNLIKMLDEVLFTIPMGTKLNSYQESLTNLLTLEMEQYLQSSVDRNVRNENNCTNTSSTNKEKFSQLPKYYDNSNNHKTNQLENNIYNSTISDNFINHGFPVNYYLQPIPHSITPNFSESDFPFVPILNSAPNNSYDGNVANPLKRNFTQTKFNEPVVNESKQTQSVTWTDELLIAEALKYDTRVEFSKKSSSAYQTALRRGKLDEICQHMLSRPQSKWTVEMLHEEALKYKTRMEFFEGNGPAYNAASKRGLLNQICQHMTSPITRWTKDMLIKEALKYNTRVDFARGSKKAYQTAQYRGILNDLCQHMKSTPKIWTDEALHEEALKYDTRSDFQRGNKNAYKAAQRRGILDEICQHITPPLIVWTDSMLKEEALKYNTRLKFAIGNNKAYNTARNRDILNEICSHME